MNKKTSTLHILTIQPCFTSSPFGKFSPKGGSNLSFQNYLLIATFLVMVLSPILIFKKYNPLLIDVASKE